MRAERLASVKSACELEAVAGVGTNLLGAPAQREILLPKVRMRAQRHSLPLHVALRRLSAAAACP